MTDVPYLYKYIPYRPEFFRNFYLRCTPRSALNDPFEMLPSTDYLIDCAHKSGEPQTVIDKLLENPGQPPFEFGDLKGIGVISLSETCDNLLMGSHYADEHRGMVLELDTSDPFFAKKTEQHRHLRRVKYRKQRLTEKHPEKNDYESLMDLFFIKSDDWQYEKEYRLTCDLAYTDDVLDTDTQLSLKGIPAGLIPYDPKRTLRMLKVPTQAVVSVICGAMMPQEHKEWVKCYAAHYGFICREAQIDHNNYKLNFE